ncbi:MAG: glycosyltransferase family 2 protein [Bacteroidota bacterium]
MELSIVTTLYKSEKFLDEFIGKCVNAAQACGVADYEIIVVNDGSPDKSIEKILLLKKKFPVIKVLDFSRNFGHHYAFFAGMKYSKGDYVFNIDCDLEVDPAVLKNFYDELKVDNYDVVYGYQEKRKGDLVEKYLGGLFWKMFNRLSEIKISQNILTERLMSRKYVDGLISMGDKNIFLAGMMFWTGFSQKGIGVHKIMRKGASTYSFSRRMNLLIEAVSSFSAYPLRLLFNMGVLISLSSFLFGTFVLFRKILFPEKILSGYTSIIVVMLFTTGLIIAAVGILGIYLGKIFNQVKNRPLYIIRNVYD